MSNVVKNTVSRHSIEHQSRTRTYTLVGPEETTASPAVLLYFHGSHQSSNVARNFTGHTFDALAGPDLLVAYPDGVHHHFNDARRDFAERTRQLRIDDVGFTRKLVESLIHDRGADPGRIYAGGFSNGGHMVLRLLHDAPGLLAGAATYAATMPAPGNFAPEIGHPDPVPTAFLTIHGTADPIAPYEGGEAGMDGQMRGAVISARKTVEYFAGINGLDDADHTAEDMGPDVRLDAWRRTDAPPAELVTVEGMGHLVPSPKAVDSRLGAGTSTFEAAQVTAEFFGL